MRLSTIFSCIVLGRGSSGQRACRGGEWKAAHQNPCRNQMIFKGQTPEVMNSIDLAMFRVMCWFKHHGKRSKDQISVMLLNLREACTDAEPNILPRPTVWDPPPSTAFKLNMDGAARGSMGGASMGGVLRDSRGKVVCMFSNFLGNQDSNTTEIVTIWKACNIISSNPIIFEKDITIVSDSKSSGEHISHLQFACVELLCGHAWKEEIEGAGRLPGGSFGAGAFMLKPSRRLLSFVPLIRHWGREINIVTDSKTVASWINEERFGCLNQVDMVYNIRSYLEPLSGTAVSYASRASNSFADNLAKLGSSSTVDFIQWGDT
ncbi:hypothetical protein Dsin_029304 [Dipteronia sinensis]|uniref:RNase H type-1 domain-containing protein n=1 Tax=Dipteronia sinensis TaxID=43782 RepID=A0AAE0DV17_9ROSI|nr:hypothetical protein Dsin_029304 [Dipteronia sinensis]